MYFWRIDDMSIQGFRIKDYVTQRSLGRHVACCLIRKKELEPKEAKRCVHHPTARFQAPSPGLLSHKAGSPIILCLNRDLGGGCGENRRVRMVWRRSVHSFHPGIKPTWSRHVPKAFFPHLFLPFWFWSNWDEELPIFTSLRRVFHCFLSDSDVQTLLFFKYLKIPQRLLYSEPEKEEILHIFATINGRRG